MLNLIILLVKWEERKEKKYGKEKFNMYGFFQESL